MMWNDGSVNYGSPIPTQGDDSHETVTLMFEISENLPTCGG